jgi:hypothetical protein
MKTLPLSSLFNKNRNDLFKAISGAGYNVGAVIEADLKPDWRRRSMLF